ncbi:alpha/beta fold hydrolase [Aurantibacillus circumpalustris]|uniref:alpha/beta fold hydrolase n=1 Tax=Aurantibacillus circumpalustris TaxID=3036359 RepID=UPI00295BFC1A|nr:alpha/beta hydrolase [Aurantibacillus circumpalustris]
MLKTALYKKEKITFSDQGKGRVVVLLHGFLGSYEIWKGLAQDLSKSYRVVAIDLPGHGASPCFGYAHSMELMAKCVKAVMDSLRVKKYVIVGHSMGGYVGLAFADIFPDNLKGLCLFHSTAYPDNEEKKKDRLRAIQLVRSNKTVYTKSSIRNLFATKNLKYLHEEISFATKIAKETSQRGIIAALHGMRDRPGRDLILGLVEYPIMMVIGELDNVLPYDQLLEQSELIKNKTVLYLEHDGHFGFLESPKQSHKELRKFLRKCF